MIDRTRNQDEYRASARRLRYRFRNSPAMKLSSLRTLAFAHDVRERVQARQVAVPHRIRDFTTRITCELATTPTLRYSRRLALLRRAQRAGIDRFDANLMIAAVQHRAPKEMITNPTRTCSLILPLGAFIFIQSIIVLGAWFVIAR